MILTQKVIINKSKINREIREMRNDNTNWIKEFEEALVERTRQ